MEPTTVILNRSSPMFNNVPPTYSCRTEMYSTKPLKSDDNNFGKMYTTPVCSKTPPLSGNSPKRENFFQSVIGVVTNIIGERVFKAHESFLSNFSNPSLSVTLVQNDGIISPDFFKTLVKGKGQGSFEETNSPGPTKNSLFQEHDNDVDDINLISKFTDYKSQSLNDKMEYWYYESATEDEEVENIIQQFCKRDDKDSCFVSNNKNMEKPETEKAKEKTTNDNGSELGLTSFMINTWQKLFKIPSQTEPVEDDEIFQKRPYSMKQKQKTKSKVVANGRGRGRAKSQLRHSGVSQSRLKKERSRHNLVFDIQDDLEAWEEFQVENWSDENPDDVELLECPIGFTFADIRPRGLSKKSNKFCDELAGDQEKKKGASFSNGRVRFVPECAVDIEFLEPREYDSNVKRDTFRPRLMSESSVDSDDSYCIVFESGSDSNLEEEEDDDSDSVITSGDDDDSDNDDARGYADSDDTDHLWISPHRCERTSSLSKVKFNLQPIVHTMVHWDYAYRAARKGPWEEMARDRERFKSRINCIKNILDPVLTTQHRTHIWQERFS